ncbi:hypothetical protein PAECIP112173_03638 [Paenibacillus sp. JJ-100]|nr:hypothetical protein PAECIP112173_03638 [Paenibacillus sp. JJ-100]
MNTINKTPMDIKDATLSGIMNSEGVIEWYINLECGSIQLHGHTTTPRIYLERFEWDIQFVGEITNKNIIIENGAHFSNHTILLGNRLCCLYVFEHEFLFDNQISFYLKDQELHVQWKAHNSNSVEEKYVIDIDTKIDFLGLNLGNIELADAKEILKFNTSGLLFYEEEGTLYLIPDE